MSKLSLAGDGSGSMDSFEEWFSGQVNDSEYVTHRRIARKAYIAGLRRAAEKLRYASTLAQSKEVCGALEGHAYNIETEASQLEEQ